MESFKLEIKDRVFVKKVSFKEIYKFLDKWDKVVQIILDIFVYVVKCKNRGIYSNIIIFGS